MSLRVRAETERGAPWSIFLRDEAALIGILGRLVNSARSTGPEGEPWRSYHLACLIRDAGHEAMFAEFVVQSMAAWDAYWRARPDYSPEEAARRAEKAERLREIDRRAKELFLSGQPEAAEETYLQGNALRSELEGEWSRNRPAFTDWLVEAGRFEEAIELFRANEAEPECRARFAAGFAQMMHKAGAGARAVRFLKEAMLSIDPKGSRDLMLCGVAFAKMDRREDAIVTLQHASAASLSEAASDTAQSLIEFVSSPLYICRHQIGLGDLSGATRTMLGTLELAAPFEYEPLPAPTFESGPGRYFKVIGASITPAAGRWIQARGTAAHLLAWLGLERQAFDLADEHRANQAEVLVNIAHGQSDRGDLHAAIRTLELIEAKTLTAEVDTWADMLSGGQLARRKITTPSGDVVRAIEGTEKDDHWGKAAFVVLLNCVRFGDASSFARVNDWAQEKSPEQWRTFSRSPIFDAMLPLTERQGVQAAINFAEAVFDRERSLPSALERVAKSIAGLAKWDPLWP